MKKYGDLDLKKIMNAENLDFARWTYSRGQCSCCYGPLDMPARFWKDGKKPRHRHHYKDGPEIDWSYYLDGVKYNEEDTKYILFKNANNGSGIVTEDSTIKDYTCIEYSLNDMLQVERISKMIQEQLDDDYVVQVPKDKYTCIIIRTKAALKNNY